MKYSSAVLLALLLLASCSTDGGIVSSNPSANSSAEVTPKSSEPSDAESADNDTADDPKADAETADLEATNEEQTDEAAADLEGVDQKNVKLVVSDQETAGQIIVAEVSTARDGWISIHKSNVDGGIQLPDSIGQARVNSGDSEKVVIDLWDAPYEGEKLWALLHVDAGDRGTYEFPEKDLAVRKNGEMMARSFKIKGKDKDREETEE
ncbi:MAG: hypothetical protein DCF15_08695 [Phormidesmis priestleyi]|uniref:DUF7282 domain-containing protein n=1 Tax=Phormidesmis priestleyi TaxID=268141 RepID=A0A2W4XJZ6_9CYAN|nr:MAG: hypothetical protein DCF15_08695 [Phormidesmis priestleyi]